MPVALSVGVDELNVGNIFAVVKLKAVVEPVSYTHLTLPTNREV